MKNLKVGTRLIMAFGAVLLVYLVVTFYALNQIKSVSENMTDFYKGAHAATIKTWEAKHDIRYLEADIYQAFTTEDSNSTKQAVDEANFYAEEFNRLLLEIKALVPQEAELIDQAINAAHAGKPYREQVLSLASNNQNSEAISVMNSKYLPELNKITTLLSDIGDKVEAYAGDTVTASTKSANFSSLILIVLALIAAALIVVLSISVTKSITKPLSLCVSRIEALSQGDLASDMPRITNRDEVGMLAMSTERLILSVNRIISDLTGILAEMSHGNLTVSSQGVDYPGDFKPLITSINEILVSLNDTLSQINISSVQVANGSEQVSSGSQALAQGATEQASSIQELSASLATIAHQVNNNAEKTAEASRMSNNAKGAVLTSNEHMQKLITAMDEISRSSEEIKKINKNIQDIAFQTNILALNAAVEAARAGSAGKGFAVVADEVRNLAGKSGEAAKVTTELIERSITSVANGVKIADETAKELLGIVEGATASTNLIDDVNIASKEQAASISQITQGVEQISAVVQTNSATSEESAAAAEELSGQAAIMRSLVARFKLSGVTGEVVTPIGRSTQSGRTRALPQYNDSKY